MTALFAAMSAIVLEHEGLLCNYIMDPVEVAKAVAIFFAAKRDFRETTIAAINAGRDVDCTAASACRLCGAFSGASQIPDDWIDLPKKRELARTRTPTLIGD